MSVEIELRARFDQAKHEQLIRSLRDHAEDLGSNDKHIYFYVLPDKLLKIVNNMSAGTAKVSLKTSRIGQGPAFPEIEMDISPADVDTAVHIFNVLGFEGAMHDAFNQRHDFRYRGIDIAVKRSEAWGYHAEFEILLEGKPTDADKTQAVERIREVADALGVRLMTEEELTEFTAEFERTRATK